MIQITRPGKISPYFRDEYEQNADTAKTNRLPRSLRRLIIRFVFWANINRKRNPDPAQLDKNKLQVNNLSFSRSIDSHTELKFSQEVAATKRRDNANITIVSLTLVSIFILYRTV
jgi:hypothetical protein